MEGKTDPAAAPNPRPESTRNGETAKNVSTSDFKTVTTWYRIGQIDRFQEGARITYTDLTRADHLLYLSRQELQKVRYDRLPGDVVKIEETPNEIVVSSSGRAYRSRSGKALVLKLPGLAGLEAMTPWSSFLAAMEGRRTAAALSIPSRPGTPSDRGREAASELQGAFLGAH